MHDAVGGAVVWGAADHGRASTLGEEGVVEGLHLEHGEGGTQLVLYLHDLHEHLQCHAVLDEGGLAGWLVGGLPRLHDASKQLLLLCELLLQLLLRRGDLLVVHTQPFTLRDETMQLALQQGDVVQQFVRHYYYYCVFLLVVGEGMGIWRWSYNNEVVLGG